LAANRPPYEGNSPITVMMKHVQEPLPDISLYNSTLPPAFLTIVSKALSKDPMDRYYTATEMGDALRQIQQQIIATQSTQMTPTLSATRVQAVQPTAVAPPPPTAPTATTTTSTPTISPELTVPTPPTPAAPGKTKRPFALPLAIVGILIMIAAAYFLLPNLLSPAPTPTSAGMVKIPANTYTVGSSNGGAQYAPQQQVTLAEYWLDRYEVTNADYANYLADNNADLPAAWNGNTFFPSGTDQQPVRGITWDAADDYCSTLGKRLPTEAEWEVAARGSSGLLYPWGDEANTVTLPNSPYAVGTVAANRSPFDVLDMAGNVWEWVAEPYTDVADNEQIARGGAYDFQKDMTYRLQGDPTVPTMFGTAGIRCAASTVEIVQDSVILVEDDFTNEASGWPVMDEGSALSGYHPPDFYHVQSGAPDHITKVNFGGNFSDINMEAAVFIDSTDTEDGLFRYGLMVRQRGNDFYAFTIAPRSNEWAVLKGSEAGLAVLDEGSSETMSGFSAESADRLRVDTSGSALTFWINGRLITQLNDADYATGDVGFFV
jgi:formylglycine-generating enzyme required for sulfatase activity